MFLNFKHQLITGRVLPQEALKIPDSGNLFIKICFGDLFWNIEESYLYSLYVGPLLGPSPLTLLGVIRCLWE